MSIEYESEKEENSLSTLRVSSLYKSFGKKTVVRGIDFSMTNGEVLGLLGPNGSGKTTTFYMIVGFYKPTAGEVFMNDQCITSLPMYKRALLGISYLPQEPSVFRKLTVEENIWAILETRKDLTKSEKKKRLEELIEEFAIGRIRKQQAYTLSGGERRRTEIARSLAIEPKFLLLDEPVANLDFGYQKELLDLMKRLSQEQNMGICATIHDINTAAFYADTLVLLPKLSPSIMGTVDEVLTPENLQKAYGVNVQLYEHPVYKVKQVCL